MDLPSSRTLLTRRLVSSSKLSTWLSQQSYKPSDIEWLITTLYKLFDRPPRDIPEYAILNDDGDIVVLNPDAFFATDGRALSGIEGFEGLGGGMNGLNGLNGMSGMSGMGMMEGVKMQNAGAGGGVALSTPTATTPATDPSILIPEPPSRTSWTHFLRTTLSVTANDLFWITLQIEREVSYLPQPEFARGVIHETEPSRLSVIMRYFSLLKDAKHGLAPLPARWEVLAAMPDEFEGNPTSSSSSYHPSPHPSSPGKDSEVKFPFASWIFDWESATTEAEKFSIRLGLSEGFCTLRSPVRQVLSNIWIISDLVGQILGTYGGPKSRNSQHMVWGTSMVQALMSLMRARMTILSYLMDGLDLRVCRERVNSRELFFVVYGTDMWAPRLEEFFRTAYNAVQ